MKDFNAIRLDNDGKVDDVAITGSLFRMERMDDGIWWVCIMRGDGSRTCFNLATKRGAHIDAIVTEDSIHCVDDTTDSNVDQPGDGK